MGLSKIARNTILAAALTAGCAVPKAVCNYGEPLKKCAREYNDAFVQYTYSTNDGVERCAAYVKYKDLDYMMSFLDIDCDGTVDIFAKKESGEPEMAFRKDNEKYFKDNFDIIFQDGIFNEMREGGKK